jgi:cellulose synthase/poly-beta-1,6-N-acetylglucosamine synthase-like glycosyltransferase
MVTVIVAARNEEEVIAKCIKYLKGLKYDKELFEIILVNDKSTDRTKEIMVNETRGLEEFKVIDSNNLETTSLKGKANAIDSAIKTAKGDILFTTDADCEVPENWIEETIKYYENNTAMVCGFTILKYDKSLFAKIQSLDWMYLLSIATCSSGINMILSCLGNNLSFGKKVYNNIGGYNKVGFSVTEDLALMRKIDTYERFKIKFPVLPGAIVKTDPCKNLKELYYQKKRWFRGATGINYLGFILGIELYAMNFLLLFGFLLINPLAYLILISIKVISELLITIPVYNKLKIRKLLKYFPLFQIYFAVYGLLLPVSFIFGKGISWKERKF